MILINPSSRSTLKAFQPFLPVAVPVGIGYLMAIARQEGLNANFIDEQVEDNLFDLVAKYIQDMQPPYFFGFSVLTASYSRALLVSVQLKKLYPNCIVCFGGIHPTAMPEEVLSHPWIDIVVQGEAERILPELYRSVKAKRDYKHIEGLSYRQNGQIIHNKRAPIIEDLDSLPVFPYHIFKSKRYDLGFIVSSRGCPYQCIFCSNRVATGKKYRFRSTESMIHDLEILYTQYDKKNICFLDDNLLVDKKRIYQLLAKIKNKRLHEKMTFAFQARGDNVDNELLNDLYSSGFRSVSFGLETASDRLMKILKKGETVAQCSEAVRMAKQNWIPCDRYVYLCTSRGNPRRSNSLC